VRLTSLASFTRRVRHAVFDESRAGRAAEIALWSNGASALAVAASAGALLWSRLSLHAVWIALALGVVTFAGLRLSLAHRVTVWIAAFAGTLTIAALGGSFAWVFAHVLEMPDAPSVAGVLGALVAALLPAWSYAQLARRRANHVRDSLLDPISGPAPHSR
jgi:hypothetical protein